MHNIFVNCIINKYIYKNLLNFIISLRLMSFEMQSAPPFPYLFIIINLQLQSYINLQRNRFLHPCRSSCH